MKIGIIGCSGVEFVEMRAAMARMGHEAIEVSNGDITSSDCEALITGESIAMCGHPLANLGIKIPTAIEYVCTPKIDTNFRGGSRGKGGKIKYVRR